MEYVYCRNICRNKINQALPRNGSPSRMADNSRLTGYLVDKNPTHKLVLSLDSASFTVGSNANGQNYRWWYYENPHVVRRFLYITYKARNITGPTILEDLTSKLNESPYLQRHNSVQCPEIFAETARREIKTSETLQSNNANTKYTEKADSGFPAETGFVCGEAPDLSTVLWKKITGILSTTSFVWTTKKRGEIKRYFKGILSLYSPLTTTGNITKNRQVKNLATIIRVEIYAVLLRTFHQCPTTRLHSTESHTL